MTGKELRKIIRSSGIKIATISKKSGIPEPTIYSLYKKPVVEHHYIEKLKLSGISIAIPTEETGHDKAHVEALYMKIEHLEEKIIMLERENEMYRKLLDPSVQVQSKKKITP